MKAELRQTKAASDIAMDVARGLLAPRKALPAWLFYDTIGSELYELITELPEYYPARTERSILEAHAAEIAAAVASSTGCTARVVELGAGSARKTQILLRAIRKLGECEFHPVDVSRSTLSSAVRRLRVEEPAVRVVPHVMDNEGAAILLSRLPRHHVVLFLGSSIGNYDEREAIALLSRARQGMHEGAVFVLGTDRIKSPDVLVPAYDDAAGVTAAFNKNVLARINRELGGRFDLDAFRHVARWNEAEARMEMHLESVRAQRVPIAAIGIDVCFAEGESIHTESSAKFDEARVERLLRAARFTRTHVFTDERGLYDVTVARAV